MFEEVREGAQTGCRGTSRQRRPRTRQLNNQRLNLSRMFGKVQVLEAAERADSNMKRFRGGLVFKAHRLVYHSTLGRRVIKKKQKEATKAITLVPGVDQQNVKARTRFFWSLFLFVVDVTSTTRRYQPQTSRMV